MRDVFAGIAGQAPTVQFLQRVLESGNATHAYLLAGGSDSDAYAIALRFAAALLAPDDDAAFNQVLQQAHPDLHVYAPGGAGGYLVEQIRELTHDAELAPIRASRKLYIVRESQRLSGAPANAFLKTLEEPPANVICILLASSEASVLETLRSRCEVLTLNARTQVGQANLQVIEMVCALSRGCSNQELFASAKRFVEISRERAQSMAEGTQDTEAYLEKYDDYLSQGAKKEIEQKAKRELSGRERAALLDEAASIRTWLRDCLVTREGAGALLAYPEFAQQTKRVAKATSTTGLMHALDAVADATTRISYNVTPQLAIEAMFLEIREALCP